MKVRVRFAPSPTGALHIGGARTALFNWLFARQHGGSFVLRIEDTDAERSQDEAINWITSALSWLGLDWDEGPDTGGDVGPYMQSQRLDLYREHAARLLAVGLAYPCFCTPEQLRQHREEQREAGRAPRYDGACARIPLGERERRLNLNEPHALRLTIPAGTTVVNDIIRGTVEFDNSLLDDLVIMKSDGMPTYNFACVVDDAAMEISHVIRGEEHLSNTPKQILVFEALGLRPPAYAHVPMILAPDRSKLSKRHGATSVEEFHGRGYLSEALVNYLALLGWSPPDGSDEMFALRQLPEMFDLDRVVKTAAVYDVSKLQWLNGNYLRTMPVREITYRTVPFLSALGIPIEGEHQLEYLRSVVELMRTRARTLVELADLCACFFREVSEYDEKGWRKHIEREGAMELLSKARAELLALEDFSVDSVEAAYRGLADRLRIGTSPLFHATRVSITGRTVGAGLFETMVLLGKETCTRRIEAAIARAEGATVD